MRNLVTLSLILVSFTLFGQIQPTLDRVAIKMWAVDSQNNTDTVVFGFDKNATNGIDSQLGENDIIGQVYNNTLELRGFQRNQGNQICGGGGYAFYSDYEFDTKINFRDILYPPNFFEFIVKGKNYPIHIYADFKEMFDSTYYNGWSRILLYDSLCHTPKIVSAEPSEKFIFTVENEKQYLIKVFLDYVFDDFGGLNGITKINSESNEYEIFPTLVTDNLTIESKLNNSNNSVGIYNSLGQNITEKTFSSSLILDLKTLKQGIYFVLLKSENHTKTKSFKITKK